MSAPLIFSDFHFSNTSILEEAAAMPIMSNTTERKIKNAMPIAANTMPISDNVVWLTKPKKSDMQMAIKNILKAHLYFF